MPSEFKYLISPWTYEEWKQSIAQMREKARVAFGPNEWDKLYSGLNAWADLCRKRYGASKALRQRDLHTEVRRRYLRDFRALQ